MIEEVETGNVHQAEAIKNKNKVCGCSVPIRDQCLDNLIPFGLTQNLILILWIDLHFFFNNLRP